MIRELLSARLPGGKKGKNRERSGPAARSVAGYPCREFSGVQMLMWITCHQRPRHYEAPGLIHRTCIGDSQLWPGCHWVFDKTKMRVAVIAGQTVLQCRQGLWSKVWQEICTPEVRLVGLLLSCFLPRINNDRYVRAIRRKIYVLTKSTIYDKLFYVIEHRTQKGGAICLPNPKLPM